jgi:hypothetical protein
MTCLPVKLLGDNTKQPNRVDQVSPPVGKRETLVGWVILAVLVLVAVGVFFKQFQYNPAIIQPAAPQSDISPEGSLRAMNQINLVQHAPEGLTPISQLESFGVETLSDKINGKAELYLSADFVRLISQRFALRDDPEAWQEVYVYDMGSLRGSFAVYSMQKRFEAEPADIGEFAYRTENALFFTHGRYYVEIVASVSQERMAEAMHEFGANFVRNTMVSKERIEELDMLPSEHLVSETISLLPSDAFGYDKFNSILTAQYLLADTELTAFLSQRQNQAEASGLVESFYRFLLANGGRGVETRLDISGVRMVEILDTYDIVFNWGGTLAGVHGAENREAAEVLAMMLKETLSRVGL